MFSILDDRFKQLKLSLDYIINNDITGNDSELCDIRFHKGLRKAFIVIIDNILFDIFYGTSKDDASFVLNNVDRISYIYNYDDGYDSIIGDVRRFMQSKEKNDYLYYKFVKKTNRMFTLDEVMNYFNGE